MTMSERDAALFRLGIPLPKRRCSKIWKFRRKWWRRLLGYEPVRMRCFNFEGHDGQCWNSPADRIA